MARICVTLDVSCGTGAVESKGLEGIFSVGVLPGGGEPDLPKDPPKKPREMDKGKDESAGTKDAPAGTAYGSTSTSQGGSAENAAKAIKKTAEKAGAGNVKMKCNSDLSTCIVCFDADHFDWNFTGQFRGYVEIRAAGWEGPGDPPENPKKSKGGQTGGGGGLKKNISWPGGAGGSIDGLPDPDGTQERDFLVIRCGMVPDPSVLTEVTLFFYGDLGFGGIGLRRLDVQMPNVRSLDPFTAMDYLEQAIRQIGVAVFRVSGNAVAVPADAEFLPRSAICVSFRAEMSSFPGVAGTGAWIVETEAFSVSAEGGSVPSMLPVREAPITGPVDRPVETTAEEAGFRAPVPLRGPTIGIIGADPRVSPTAPRANIGPTPAQLVAGEPVGVVAADSRRPDGTINVERSS